MSKTLQLNLSDFQNVPHTLSQPGNPGMHTSEIEVKFASICHQMYLDIRGASVPRPNPLFSDYSRFLMPDRALRFRSNGLGSHKEIRVGELNRFGKAFCRWFLHDHCEITYFAHMDDMLNKGRKPELGQSRVERTSKGDSPDYVCADRQRHVFLAEAKGTTAAISFGSAKFANWRGQFETVTVIDHDGKQRAVKGYIVATRLVTDKQQNAQSILLAEDPATPGEAPLDADSSPDVARRVIANHYASVFARLRLPLLAQALVGEIEPNAGFLIPVGVWRCLIPGLSDREFVGGYFPPDGVAPEDTTWGRVGWGTRFGNRWNSLDLSAAGFTFFGLDRDTFIAAKTAAVSDRDAIAADAPSANAVQLPSDFSLLRDGTVLAPLDYFRFERFEVI